MLSTSELVEPEVGPDVGETSRGKKVVWMMLLRDFAYS